MYQKLPALADSLPDAWGNQLFELWRIQNHIPNADITPLDKLSFIGKRGMGALEFLPQRWQRRIRPEMIQMSSRWQTWLSAFSSSVKMPTSCQRNLSLCSPCLRWEHRLVDANLKAIIAINKATGEIRSGQVAGLQDYDYYILKFGDTKYSSAEIEMTYYEMAIKSGIDSGPSRLYEIDGNRNFITKRFDRDGERKLHTQTLAAISPETDSYEGLVAVCRKLHLPETDCQEVFRRLVFNVLSNNTDDHTKNFSFVMDEAGLWRLSPAYDLTYIIDTGGYLPNTGHCMYVRSKLHHISYDDAILFAKDNGIRRARCNHQGK